jgi:hypothetical protein
MAQRSPACATRTAAARAGRLRRISSSTPPGAAPLPSLCYNRSAGRCQRRPPLASIWAMRHASLPSQKGVMRGVWVLRLLVLAFAAIFRPKALLIVENLCLRQQLVVVQRRHPRPRLSDADRRFWILARPMVQRLASSVADCETGNSSALAASGLEGVLEVAILS